MQIVLLKDIRDHEAGERIRQIPPGHCNAILPSLPTGPEDIHRLRAILSGRRPDLYDTHSLRDILTRLQA